MEVTIPCSDEALVLPPPPSFDAFYFIGFVTCLWPLLSVSWTVGWSIGWLVGSSPRRLIGRSVIISPKELEDTLSSVRIFLTVGWLVHWSVCHNDIKGREVTLQFPLPEHYFSSWFPISPSFPFKPPDLLPAHSCSQIVSLWKWRKMKWLRCKIPSEGRRRRRRRWRRWEKQEGEGGGAGLEMEWESDTA